METSSLPDTESKALVIRMLIEPRGKIGEFSKNFKKEIVNMTVNIKSTQK